MDSISAADPFERIQLAKSPDKFLNEIMENYNLGSVKNYKVLEKGIVELNIKAATTRGDYVVKIFSNKELPRVIDIASSQQALRAQSVPFPKVYETITGKPYFVAYPNENAFYGCVIEWFDGDDFTDSNPTETDLKKIAKYLATINRTKLKITQIYDDCFPINLPKEYNERKKSVEPEVKPLIENIIRELNGVNFDKLQWGSIHGDLSWEHVLKNKAGELCILDLGALNISPITLDLAYAMSYYCVSPKEPLKSDFERKYSIILDEYLKHVKLSAYELEHLPLFVKASWAHDYVIGRSHKDIFRDKLWFKPERFRYLLKQEFLEAAKR